MPPAGRGWHPGRVHDELGPVGGTTSKDTDDDDATSGGGGSPAAALAILIACGVLVVAGLGGWLATTPAWSFEQWFFVVDLADCLVYGLVAAVLVSRTRHPAAVILAVTAVGGGLAAVGFQWSELRAAHPDLPALDTLQWFQNSAWVPGTLALIVVLPWLVRDEPLGRAGRLAVVAGAVAVAWTYGTRLVDPFPWPEGDPLSPLGVRSTAWLDRVEAWFVPQMRLVVALGALAVADVVRRWTRLPDERRRGLGWLAVATALMTISFVPLALPADVAADLPGELTPVMHLASQIFLPAAVLVAVLRQRLWGVDLAVSRTVLWSLLTGAVVGANVTAAWVVGLAFPSHPGLAQGFATAVVVAGLLPARNWLQQRVDHLVRGEAAEPLRAVRQVGRQLGAAADAAELVDGLASGLVHSLRLGAATIDGPGGEVVAAAGAGAPSGVPTVRDLVHQQELVGCLRISARPGERLDAATLSSLDELVPVLAAAVHLAATTRALAESRARIAGARDEERRALRRELHDGLGPAIAGVGLGLRAGRNLIERDPAAAAALLDQLAVELDARVEEVRDLARGLVPPALDELGLVPALDDLAERYRVGGLDVTVDAGGIGVLDGAVASAVHGIVAEAIRNVHRHAAASRCDVVLRAGDELVVTVTDDGIGVPDGVVRGVGLTSMRERAEGVGGRLAVGPAPTRGTRVEVRIPVLAARP